MAGSGAHQPQAARALGACLRRLSLLAAGRRREALAPRRSLLSYGRKTGWLLLGISRAARSRCLRRGAGKGTKMGGSRGPGTSLASRGDWLAPPDPGLRHGSGKSSECVPARVLS